MVLVRLIRSRIIPPQAILNSSGVLWSFQDTDVDNDRRNGHRFISREK